MEDVGDDPKGKEGAVPDRLHPGDGPPSLQERRSPGPSAQLGPLHVPGLYIKRPPTEHKRYLGGRKRWPVRLPGEPTRTDKIFAAIQRAVPKAQPCEARRNAWISETTWRLIDERVSARRDPQCGQAFTRRLGKEVKKSLAEDRRRRADKLGAEVEALVKEDPHLIQEAWYRLQGWYKTAVDRAPPPAQARLNWITAERVALYSRVPPPGDSIPLYIEPFAVEDWVPDEGEIEWAVKRLRNNRVGGPSRMQTEDLKGWLAAARRGEKKGDTAEKEGGDREDTREGAENWERVVELVQTAFRDGYLARRRLGRR